MAENQFICQACGITFATRAELDQHNKQAHAAAEHARWTIAQQAVGGVSCPVCGAQFSTIDQVERHARREHRQSK